MFQIQSENNPEFDAVVADLRRRRELGTPYHSLRLSSEVWEGTISLAALEERFHLLGVPQDLSGATVLDIGCASGWCAFEAERRGARVTAVDCALYPEFLYAHAETKSSIQYFELDIEELTVDRLGTFDYVLFLGVLYHLRHPLLGLERVCSLTRKCAFIESYTIDAFLSQGVGLAKPIMEFYEGVEMGGQIDNWWGPTTNCIGQMCRAAGFAETKHLYTADRRSGFAGRRIAGGGGATQVRPWLTGAANTRTGKAMFAELKDQYLAMYFRLDGTAPVTVARDDVFLRMEGFEFPAITVSQLDERGWQANFKWPSWIGASPCAVSVAVMGWVSNEVAINQNLQASRVVNTTSNLTEATSLSVFRIEFSPINAHIRGAVTKWAGRIFLLDSSGDGLDLTSATVQVSGKPMEITTRGRVDERLWQLSIVVDPSDHPTLRGMMEIGIGDGRHISNVPFSVPDAVWGDGAHTAESAEERTHLKVPD